MAENQQKPDAPLTAADIQRAIEAANESRDNRRWKFYLMVFGLGVAITLAYLSTR